MPRFTSTAEHLAEFKGAEAQELRVSEQKEDYTRRIRNLTEGSPFLMMKSLLLKGAEKDGGERGRILEAVAEAGRQ